MSTSLVVDERIDYLKHKSKFTLAVQNKDGVGEMDPATGRFDGCIGRLEGMECSSWSTQLESEKETSLLTALLELFPITSREQPTMEIQSPRKAASSPSEQLFGQYLC